MTRWLRSDAVFGALVVVCLVLSLRPAPGVEALAARALTPFELAARATWPLARAGRSRTVIAGPERGARRADEAHAASVFLDALYASAMPDDPELETGWRPVPAAVVRRPSRTRDEVIVLPWTLEGLEPGLPVVHRDAYVGRVAEVDRAEGTLRVELITGRDTFVGARLLPPTVLRERGLADLEDSVDLVVGGVAVEARRRGGSDGARTLLAAHNPGRDRGAFGEGELRGAVVVHELLPELDPHARLAEGFRLGTLVPGVGEEDWRVEPLLDYLHGLFHVVVLSPRDEATVEPSAPPHPLEENAWIRARAYTPGDPAPWRSSVGCDRGRRDGVAVGAAVVRGSRLLGRVVSTTELGARVALLDSAGLELSVACRLEVEGDAAGAPLVLGRLTALGRDANSGRPRFHWRDVLPLEPALAADGDSRVRVTLYTGSGEAGMPAGLLLGTADVPVGPSGGGGHVFELDGVLGLFEGEAEVWIRLPARGRGEGP